MRGNTFKALKLGNVATIWENGIYRGRCGTIASKSGVGRKGEGWVIVEFANGECTNLVSFDKVTLGDNSSALNED